MSKKAFFDKYNMESSIFSIGVFSRIEEQKGQHLLIEAIRQSKHKIQLFIVGHCMDEKYKNKLKISLVNTIYPVIFVSQVFCDHQ